ncbi:MAG: hypothetical protein K2X51_12625 [Burkholderiales bacterium]|nr:hypothetical protein [Burkholderiales bacterium]
MQDINRPKVTLPSVGISDKAFRYRRAADTDISKTFARVRREQRVAAQKAAQAALPGIAPVVVPLRPTTGGGK